LVSFGHCIVGLSLFDERLLNAPLVSFGHCIVGLSLFDQRLLSAPLVSFGQCIVEQRQTDNIVAKKQKDKKINNGLHNNT
jgi:hypothetical protein